MNRKFHIIVAVLAAVVVAVGCIGRKDDDTADSGIVSSRAYQGHETDVDQNNLVAVYPEIVGTRLDDCTTCHRGATVEYSSGKTSTLTPCSYCHLLVHPDSGIVSGAPSTMHDTLNPYGVAYKYAGRSRQALVNIAHLDSDGDSYDNLAEISDNRFPGNAGSKPGQPIAPTYTFTWAEVKALTSHTQFMLCNTTKQQFDFYATYTGVKIADLLAAAGVNLTNATGVTVFAPDGFSMEYTLTQINTAWPGSYYYDGLDVATMGSSIALVEYPDPTTIPAGVTSGALIPGEKWVMLAYQRDGADLDTSYLDITTGRIVGEGPFRSIIPGVDTDANNRKPDRGKYETAQGDGWDFNPSGDHNAGACVKGVIAIRVDPMPAGLEEIDWKDGGWTMVEDGVLVIYGEGVTGN